MELTMEIDVYYICISPNGSRHYRLGKFLSHKHAVNLMASWNYINGGWAYGPISKLDAGIEYTEVDHRSHKTHLAF